MYFYINYIFKNYKNLVFIILIKILKKKDNKIIIKKQINIIIKKYKYSNKKILY